MTYLHELDEWPLLRWRDDVLSIDLADIRHRQGRLIGHMESLGFRLQSESLLYTLTEEVVKSSDIEGEILDKEQVRSSIARRLGIEAAGSSPIDQKVEGVVEMMLDATQNFSAPLTETRLFEWHASLFPTGRSGMSRIKVGGWRTDEFGPMEIVSGPMGRERIHFEAPAAELVPHEMRAFLDWFETANNIDPVLVAGVAHLWFVTVHPFDDGNGRIARAITEMALARSENSAQRFYSMSATIRARRNGYYEILESTQRGTLDITSWLTWFLNCLGGAFDQAEGILSTVLAKAAFWTVHRETPFNPRQRNVLNRLLDGFVGKLTSSKWAKLAKVSQDTASRDIDDLLKKGILKRGPEGGRSTAYELILPGSRLI